MVKTLNKSTAPRLASLVGTALLLSVPVYGEQQTSYAYVRSLEGSATVFQTDGERVPAELNLPILTGEELWVSPRSRVELHLPGNNILRLDGNSELRFESLAFSADSNHRTTSLRLLNGEAQLWVREESLGDELPRIDTENSTIYVQSPGLYRIVASDSQSTQVVVREGHVELLTARGSALARAGEEVWIQGDRWPSVATYRAGPRSSLETWGDQLYSEYRRARHNYLDSSHGYQAARLGTDGAWIQVGGRYGWRPRMHPSWRPYSAGFWRRTPTGLFWVAAETWGHLTHHYGSWDYAPGHGWLWYPALNFSPAWVYWYWGPSHVGWSPVGYYTNHYRRYWPGLSHYGRGIGGHFRSGLYGWVGGSWNPYRNWTFCSVSSFGSTGSGGSLGRSTRSRQFTSGAELERELGGSLPRGVLTTDTTRVARARWTRPEEAQRLLIEGARDRRGSSIRSRDDLEDVSAFVARGKELPDAVARRVVRADRADDKDPARAVGRAGNVRNDRNVDRVGTIQARPMDRTTSSRRSNLQTGGDVVRPSDRNDRQAWRRSRPQVAAPTAVSTAAPGARTLPKANETSPADSQARRTPVVRRVVGGILTSRGAQSSDAAGSSGEAKASPQPRRTTRETAKPSRPSKPRSTSSSTRKSPERSSSSKRTATRKKASDPD